MKARKRKSRRGIFIAIEGIDGAGTTTQTAMIASWLRRNGKKVHRTAEPSRGATGRYIRKLLKDKNASPGQLALLFASDRLEHLENEIYPALKRGEWVVSDRYRISSLAYQGTECDPAWVKNINRYAPPADITILIDLPVKTALERVKSRGSARERFESGKKLEKIRKAYLALAKRREEGRVVVIDGKPSEEKVLERIKEEITRCFL